MSNFFSRLIPLFLFSLFFCSHSVSAITSQSDSETAVKQALYFLENDKDLVDITDRILLIETLPATIKERFIQQGRRFYLFTYPSEGLKIKSMISFVRTPETQPLFLVLRGASRMEALPCFMYPQTATLFAADSEATIVLGTHRDAVSEGIEEYGGSDLNDVYSLNLYLPVLASRLGIVVDEEKKFLIGPSRGGMQLFLALARFPELQSHFKKCVSLSGLLNTEISAVKNPGWAQKMASQFQFDGSQEWLDKRNPVLALPKIAKKELPFLIIQGTADSKICLEEGYSMLRAMKKHGFTNVSYWEVFGAEHTLKNRPEYISLIRYWLLGTPNGDGS